ncbi:MAG TPA: hypothetical protein VMH86_03825 [Rhizomicrobium sp.]|nr:hypothetical protein [Rhizomicrobium sp.]
MSTITVPAGSTLANTNAIIAQMEQTNGPLTAMGNDGKSSTFTFDDAGDNPANPAVAQASSSPAPANSTQVCAGSIFVAGTLTPSTAYRAN